MMSKINLRQNDFDRFFNFIIKDEKLLMEAKKETVTEDAILTVPKPTQTLDIEEVKTHNKSNRYTYDEVIAVTKIQVKLARNEISLDTAEKEILNIVKTFPIKHLSQYNNNLKKYLNGVGEYGFAFPSNWAKGLLEVTNYDPLVIQAFKDQQQKYKEKDGKINRRLEVLLQNV